MILHAWFDPKQTTDLRESLVARQLLGSWHLRDVETFPAKKLCVHREDLRLSDGSALQITVTCDQTFAEARTTVAVLSGGDSLYLTTVRGTCGFSAKVPTGKGGFLTLQMDYPVQVQATHGV